MGGVWPTWLLAAATAAAPNVELITMAPGDALYTLWGHAALRVIDPDKKRDVTYNFGSVDLSKGFFMRMLEGRVEAYVSVWPYPRTLESYSAEDRTIVRRGLNLPPGAAAELVDRLDAIVAKDRGAYRYHHFENNCSTQVADVIDRALGGALTTANTQPVPRTFRERALTYVRHRPVLYVGIDIALSAPTDHPITAWQLTFLPEELGRLLDKTEVDGKPLVSDLSAEYEGRKDRSVHDHPWPWLWAYLLLALPLMLVALYLPRTALAVYAMAAGLVGVAIGTLELGTQYDFLSRNLNLLIFLPTYVVVAVLTLLRGRWAQGLIVWHCRLAFALWITAAVLWATGASLQNVGPMLLFSFGPVMLFTWAHR